ncbi:hypothetical protein [Reyranella sp.]|uniref:PIN-like domain-containing protein n=1 Tax=Reyranella sp. TaxID=1929291 RepID=UPI003D1065FB
MLWQTSSAEAIRHADPPFRVEYFHDPKGPFRFKQDTPDDVWIPIIAQQKWFILSHDNQWHKNQVEHAAPKQHAAGCFYLYGNNSLTWYKLRAFMWASDKITGLAEATARPFVFRAAATGHVTHIKI